MSGPLLNTILTSGQVYNIGEWFAHTAARRGGPLAGPELKGAMSMQDQTTTTNRKSSPRAMPKQLRHLATFLGIFLGAVFLCLFFFKLHVVDGYASPVFVLAVFLISRFTDGYFYGLLAALLGVISVNYFFTYPYMEFNVTMYGYPLTFIVFLTVAIVTSAVTTKAKQWDNIRIENERERMHADLLRSISHDIRTPLTSISGASSAILEDPDLDAEAREGLVEDIHNESQNLIRIVENLLSITRISGDAAIEIVPWDVEEVIGEAVGRFRKRFPDITVKMHMPDEILYVPMEPMLIEQVLGNLMENAVRHGSHTTKIDIAVEKRTDDILVSVQDDGSGFSMTGLRAAFHRDAVQSRKLEEKRSDGTRDMGLGLSVCDTIVRAHKGVIFAQNTPAGARVSFTLPLGKEEE